jgi:O-antigen ligase
LQNPAFLLIDDSKERPNKAAIGNPQIQIIQIVSSSSSPGHPASSARRQILSLLILLSGCLVSVFLAGGPRQGGEGVFLLTAGAVLLFFRPLQATSWWFWLGGLLVLLLCSASLLPSGYLPIPLWKQILIMHPAVTLPSTVTCDPYAALFWVAMLAVSVATALFVLGQPLQGSALRIIAFAAVAGCTAYALTAMGVWLEGWNYPFFKRASWAQPAFGFFTNRNQTAGFLLTGAVLSLGMIRRGFIGRRWLYVLAGVAAFVVPCYCLLFLSASRGGLVFLVLGCVIWFAGLGGYRSRGLLVIAIFLAIVLGVSLVHSNSALTERLLGGFGEPVAQEAGTPREIPKDHAETSGGRVSIWLDTLGMIREQPLVGGGLGSYPFVYQYHARRSLSEMTALHAESSWLTLTAEAGVPALLAVLGCLGLLMAGLPKLEKLCGRDWPLRWGFLAAFFAELLHGLVDVPLHKPELGWWLLLLGAIGFAPLSGEPQPGRPGLGAGIQRMILLFAGIGALLLGGWMIAAQLGKARALPPFAPYESEKRIESLYRDDPNYSAKDVIATIRRELVFQPVNHRLHFLLGCMTLQTHEGLRPAEAEFRAEQLLCPNDPAFPEADGVMIAIHDTEAAVAYWKESLRRRLLLDNSPNCPIRRSEHLFYTMISDAKDYPALAARLGEIAAASPELRLMLLSQSTTSPTAIMNAFGDGVFLRTLTPGQKVQLLELWYQRGDRTALAAYLGSHPELAAEAIPVRALLLADGPDPRQGCQLLRETYHPRLPEADINDSVIHAAKGEVPTDPLKASSYYLMQGNMVTARRLINSPGLPEGEEAQRLRAALAIREGRWKDAVRQLLQYLHMTKTL